MLEPIHCNTTLGAREFLFRSEAAIVSRSRDRNFFLSRQDLDRSRLRRSQSQFRYEKKKPLAPNVLQYNVRRSS